MEAISKSLERFRKHFTEHPDDAAGLLTTGESPADATLPPSDLATWTMVANQFLNLVGRLVGWEKEKMRISYTVSDVQIEQQLSVVFPAPEHLQRGGSALPDVETEPACLGRLCKKFDTEADDYAKEETWQARKGAKPVNLPAFEGAE